MKPDKADNDEHSDWSIENQTIRVSWRQICYAQIRLKTRHEYDYVREAILDDSKTFYYQTIELHMSQLYCCESCLRF